MNAAWADLLEALESPSSTSTPSPTSPPHGSLLTPLVAYSDADSHHLELVVRDAQRKRRLNAQAQDVGKAFEDAICAYFFPFPPARNTSAQTHRPVAGPGLTRSKSSASSTPAPRARGKSQWPFPTSPLTPTSSQIWLDSARRLGELDRTVDLMLEDNSRERGLAAFTRPQLSKEVRPLVAKRTCCHIGWFPSEILVQIFLQLSEHSSSVLSITHVNCRWRESALDIPSLFTSTALWDKWSPPLLEEWNARTKGKPLSVKFSNDALLRMHNEDDFYSLVQSSHHVWEELDIAVATFGQSGHTLDACTSILHLEMPLLRRLRLVGSNDIGLSSTALDVPSRLIDSLTHLRLSNAVIIVTVHDATETTESAPHLPRSVAIDDVFVSNERWIEFWRACHGFGTVKVARCGVTERQVTSEPGLQDLPTMIRMVFSDSTDVLGLPMILSCRFSNLRHLTIKGGPALTKDMWIELTRCAPKLSTISIYHHERAIVEFLNTRVDLGSVAFPALKHLTVIAPREKKQVSALGDCSAFEVALIRYIDSRHRQHLPPLSALTVSRACASCRNTLMELERTTPYAPQYIKRIKVVKLRNGSLDCLSSTGIRE